MRYFLFMLLTAAAFAVQPKPEDALKRLIEGNARFMKGTKQGMHRDPKTRLAKKTYQHPFGVVVACSDSRVSPEILFDTGIGELFVVRVAGNVISEVGMESIGYAIGVLETPLILVVGHQNCGAVEAVLHDQAKTIPEIAGLVEPAVAMTLKQKASNPLKTATELNALNMKNLLLKNPLLRKKVDAKELIIEAGYYNFATGKVEIL